MLDNSSVCHWAYKLQLVDLPWFSGGPPWPDNNMAKRFDYCFTNTAAWHDDPRVKCNGSYFIINYCTVDTIVNNIIW